MSLALDLHRWSRSRGSVIGRDELLDRGVSSSRIGRLTTGGLLWPRHAGVYAVGREDIPPYGVAWAAYLATRGRGEEPRVRALTGRSAAALLGIGPVPAVPEVLVRASRAPSTAGLSATSTRSLPVTDLWSDPRGLTITSWCRTMLVLAATSSVADLVDVLDRSDRRGLLDLTGLDEAMRAATCRDGIPKLRRALEPFAGLPPGEYLSLLERLAHVEFRRAGLPEPEVNGRVILPGGVPIRVDLLLRDELLAIEVDGRASHDRSSQFHTDRWRDRELQKLGFGLLRFGWWDVKRRPTMVTDDVWALLHRRGAAHLSR